MSNAQIKIKLQKEKTNQICKLNVGLQKFEKF